MNGELEIRDQESGLKEIGGQGYGDQELGTHICAMLFSPRKPSIMVSSLKSALSVRYHLLAFSASLDI